MFPLGSFIYRVFKIKMLVFPRAPKAENTLMIKPRVRRKLPQCNRCRFYTGNPFTFCLVVAQGPEGRICPYFAPDPFYFEENLNNN